MPDERCEIELLKNKLSNFEHIFNRHCEREYEYIDEIKKNLEDVSEKLQLVITKQSSQVGFYAGVTAAFGLIGSIAAWFFSK